MTRTTDKTTLLTTSPRRLPLALALGLTMLVAPLAAQGKEPPADEGSPKKLAEWPELSKKDDGQARAVLTQFRKEGEELHAKAHEKLVAFGAAVAPVLLPKVNDRANNSNEHLFRVLDEVCGPPHAALLARELGRPSVELRRYLLRRLGTFRDTELAAVFEKSLDDKDPEVQFQAGLGALAVGSVKGLDVVLASARQRWSEVQPQIAEVLTPARSVAISTKVLDHIARARPTEQMAGLRLLRYLMTKQQAVLLRHYLEASDFQVKREAINAARVVHGEDPLENLASFQAINMAKEWLKKL